MFYIVDDKRYYFKYSDLVGLFSKYEQYTDSEFIDNIVEILHFACFVSYMKGLSLEETLSDEGIVHELVHILHIGDEPTISSKITEIRNKFNKLLKIC